MRGANADMDGARGDTFGMRLRRLREAAALTQEELAARAGLAAKSIGALERGERLHPHPQTVRALAAALGLAEAEQAAFIAATAAPTTEGIAAAAPRLAPSVSSPPVPPTPLLGRAEDVAAIGALLGAARLVTLTGPGGVGKTRLALAAATVATDHYADGVTLVSLAPLADPALVLPAIALAFGVREIGGMPLRDTLHAALRARHALLVLDNVEHLLAAAPDIAALLAACAHLAILATSRAPLHIGGEHEYPVAPLALPPRDRAPCAAVVAAAPAAQLFVARARAVVPAFALTDANAAAVAAICRRLDGLPLALELVAAWVKLLPPTGLLARLDRALPLLEGGGRDLPARQQSLRDTIAWSHDLLTAHERVLVRRLAIFAGGGTLAAAEAVCADAALPASAVLAAAAALLDQSLVLRVSPADPTGAGTPAASGEGVEPRLVLLETIREYAAERLAASGEGEDIRRAHAAHYLALAEAQPSVRDAAWGDWLARLDRERDNLRAALAWAVAAEATETALRFGWALRAFWQASGTATEGRRWLAQILPLAGAAPAILRARALGAAAYLAHYQGDYAPARALHEAQLALYREVGDRSGMAGALDSLAGVVLNQGEYARARRWHEEALALRRALGDRPGIAYSLRELGLVAQREGDYSRAQALYEEGLTLARDVGDRWCEAAILSDLGWLHLLRGDLARADALLSTALANQRTLGIARGAGESLARLGRLALARGDPARAQALLVESLDLSRDQGIRWGVAFALEGLAGVAAALGDPDRAAQLGGAAAALRDELGAPLPPSEHTYQERAIAAARDQLGEAVWNAAWAAGRAMPFERVVALAQEPGGVAIPAP